MNRISSTHIVSSSLVRKAAALVLACAFAVTGAACTADHTGKATDVPADQEARVQQDGETLRLQLGADEVAATQGADGRQVIQYYEAKSWVGTLSYRASDRVLKVSAPGFEGETVLAFDLGSQTGSLGALLGLNGEQEAQHLGGMLRIDARLAGNASVPDVLAAHQAGERSSGSIHPQMLPVCTSSTKAAVCGILTLGLCGYVMIVNCLVMN